MSNDTKLTKQIKAHIKQLEKDKVAAQIEHDQHSENERAMNKPYWKGVMSEIDAEIKDLKAIIEDK